MKKPTNQSTPNTASANVGQNDDVQSPQSATQEVQATPALSPPCSEVATPSTSPVQKREGGVDIPPGKKHPKKSALRRAKDSMRRLTLGELLNLQYWLENRLEGLIRHEYEAEKASYYKEEDAGAMQAPPTQPAEQLLTSV